MGGKQRTAQWIAMVSEGPWCTGAYSKSLQASIFLWNWRVWNKTEMAGRGQLMGLSTWPTLLWVYCFSIIFCLCACVCVLWCVFLAMWVYMCVHTCAWGTAPSSLKLNGRQPAVKLDCLSLSGGLSLLRWKEGERSGPKALLVEAHFEAFKVWHTLTYCQKHNDLQTAILSIKKVWQSHSIGPRSQSHTPIKSSKQWLSILSKRLYLAPTQKAAARIPVIQSIWLLDTVGTIPFVTQIQWFLEWGFSHISEPGEDSIHPSRTVHYLSEQILKKRLSAFGFAVILEKALDKHLFLPIGLYIATS